MNTDDWIIAALCGALFVCAFALAITLAGTI